MMRARLRRLVRDQAGAGGVEFALVSVVFIAMMVAIVDLGRFAYEINALKTATRVGARYAAVHRMVSAHMEQDWSGTYGNGGVVPNVTVTCTSTSCSSGGRNATAFTNIVNVMRGYDARIQEANVEVVYQHVGIGVVGNPYAPDVEPLVTVRLTGLTFAPGSLQIFGVRTLVMPSMATTLSGESLKDPA